MVQFPTLVEFFVLIPKSKQKSSQPLVTLVLIYSIRMNIFKLEKQQMKLSYFKSGYFLFIVSAQLVACNLSTERSHDGQLVKLSEVTKFFKESGLYAFERTSKNNSDTYFVVEYATDLTEAGLSVIQTSDSGYICTGLTSTYAPGKEGLLVVKVDPIGNIEWSATYGSKSSETGSTIIETKNNEYIICGHSALYGETDHDIVLMRISNKGDLLWSKMYGGSDYDYGTDVIELPDGSIILEGYTYSYGEGNDDLFLAKFTSEGDSLWTKIYGGELNEHGYAVEHTYDNGFIITGFTKSFNNNFYREVYIDPLLNPYECFYDVYVIKTDSLGDIEWTKTYGKEGHDRGQSIKKTADSCYIIVGHSTSFGNESDILLLKIDRKGNLMWSKIYSTPLVDAAYCVEVCPSGDYLICGESNYAIDDVVETCGLLFRTDQNGELLGSKLIQLEGGNTALYSCGANKTGYFAAGKSIRRVGYGFGLIFLKLNELGNSNIKLSDSKIVCSKVGLDTHPTTTKINRGLDEKEHEINRTEIRLLSYFINYPTKL